MFEKHKSASPKAIPIIFTHKLFRRAGDFNGNVLTASPAPSDSIGADWVKATYDDVTTDADYDCDLTVIKVEIDSIVDDPNDPNGRKAVDSKTGCRVFESQYPAGTPAYGGCFDASVHPARR